MDFISYYFQNIDELSVLQFETPDTDVFECISIADAQKDNSIIISELDKSIDLNNLVIHNKSDKYVFIVSGELLLEAKHTRIVNRSAMLTPNSKNIIPVTYIDEKSLGSIFINAYRNNTFIPFIIRSKISTRVSKALKKLSSTKSIQSVAFDDKLILQNTSQESIDHRTVYNNHRSNLNTRVFNYTLDWRANGLALFKNDKLLSIDIFHNKQIFKSCFYKLIKGLLIDTGYEKVAHNKLIHTKALKKTQNMLDKISKVKCVINDSIGAGFEKRFNLKKLCAFELYYKNTSIHLSALANANYING